MRDGKQQPPITSIPLNWVITALIIGVVIGLLTADWAFVAR